MSHVEALTICVAVSLYNFNISPAVRAQRLYDHFNGDCAELDDLVRVMAAPCFAATELAAPTALAFVTHALTEYEAEARERVLVNLGLHSDL